MKAKIREPEVIPSETSPKSVKVDADKVPDVEWNCICAILLPAIRAFYGLDDEKGGGNNGCNTRGSLESKD